MKTVVISALVALCGVVAAGCLSGASQAKEPTEAERERRNQQQAGFEALVGDWDCRTSGGYESHRMRVSRRTPALGAFVVDEYTRADGRYATTFWRYDEQSRRFLARKVTLYGHAELSSGGWDGSQIAFTGTATYKGDRRRFKELLSLGKEGNQVSKGYWRLTDDDAGATLVSSFDCFRLTGR